MTDRTSIVLFTLVFLLLTSCTAGKKTSTDYVKGPKLPATQLPKYIAGEYFAYDSGVSKLVTEVDGEHIIWKNNRGAISRNHCNFLYPIVSRVSETRGSIESSVSGVSGHLWPLQTGNTSRFWSTLKIYKSAGMIDNYVERWNSCNVEGTARVTVPAGTFDTYVITCQRSSANDHGWRGTKRFYYSSDVGNYVMQVRRSPGKPESIVQLIKYGFSSEYLGDKDKQALSKLLARVLDIKKDGTSTKWTSSTGKVKANLTPVKTYTGKNGERCRQYNSSFLVNGRESQNSRDMCKSKSGKWVRI